MKELKFFHSSGTKSALFVFYVSRKKLQRFAEISELQNVIGKDAEDTKERIHAFLGKDEGILEIGCGRGEYTVALAEKFPEKKCFGIDYQGERIWYGAKEALERKLDNVLFIQLYAHQLMEVIPEHSISEIIIPFSDPYPKKKHEKRRLTSPHFLEMYQKLLIPNGIVHVKNDDEAFFHYSLKSIEAFGGTILERDEDVSQQSENSVCAIQTYYEKKHRTEGKKIFYLKFTL